MPYAGDMTALCDGVMAWRDPRRTFYKKLRGTRKTGFQPPDLVLHHPRAGPKTNLPNHQCTMLCACERGMHSADMPRVSATGPVTNQALTMRHSVIPAPLTAILQQESAASTAQLSKAEPHLTLSDRTLPLHSHDVPQGAPSSLTRRWFPQAQMLAVEFRQGCIASSCRARSRRIHPPQSRGDSVRTIQHPHAARAYHSFCPIHIRNSTHH